ncbi:MAG TPA: DnaB-like helicase C-terminal domain-containing protein [Terriglobia bacterium]|nr:DnaB-like helicase C-terminal domain-containing protein [Terriglobia bacterium]
MAGRKQEIVLPQVRVERCSDGVELMHNIELEQLLIGSVFLNNAIFPSLSEKVSPTDFYEPVHQNLWEVCAQLIGAGKKANPVTVATFLPEITIGKLNLRQYLAHLAAEGAIASEAPQLADMVKDLSDRRALQGVASELGKAGSGDPVEMASWAIQELDALLAARVATGTPSLTMEQSVARAMDAAAKAYAREGSISGLSTGLRDLDRKLLGFQRGELIVMAGRPGSGKTAASLCLSRNMASKGHKGIFYSLEMGDVQLSQRMLTDEAYDAEKVAYTRLRSGRFTENQFMAIRDAGYRLQGLPMRIEQQPAMSLSQVGSRARQEKRTKGLDFIVIDYLGLMKSSGRYAGNRVNEIGELTAGVKALAKELDCAALLLCQLSRGVDGREDKRPTMADLRDSGNIEQDADVILMLYREAYYLERKEPAVGSADHLVWEKDMERCLNQMHMIVEKNRSGPIGTVKVFCDVASNAIRDCDYQREEMADQQMAF